MRGPISLFNRWCLFLKYQKIEIEKKISWHLFSFVSQLFAPFRIDTDLLFLSYLYNIIALPSATQTCYLRSKNSIFRCSSFHSGYDFGYILKMLTCQPLPPTESEFHDLLKTYFPCVYDIKYLMRSCKNLRGGLSDLADDLQVPRIGPQHQAGSDSLLTLQSFFKMKSSFFDDHIDDDKYLGILYGLGPNYNPSFAAATSTVFPYYNG